jgi:hypothetical protein
MAKSKEFIESLPDKAWQYIEECMKNTRKHVSGSGKVVNVKDRHIPTIGYFLRIWLPLNYGETFVRSTWYAWLNDENNSKSDTIKNIDEIFTQLATDIVANEGKGIFYAKNKLGMTDKAEQTIIGEQPLFGKDVNE